MARARPAGILGGAAIISYLVARELFEKQTENMLRKIGIVKEDGSLDHANLKEKWKEVPEGEKQAVLEQILRATSGNTVSFDPKKNQLIIHGEGTNGKLPVDPKDIDDYYKMFADLGMPEPTMFLSKGTEENIKAAIASIQEVSPEIRSQWLARFNIKV
jgi:hypothetical protein